MDDLTVLDGICETILKQSKYKKETCMFSKLFLRDQINARGLKAFGGIRQEAEK